MRLVFAAVAALLVAGCSQYGMPDLTFTDADHKGGYDRMGTCDACQAKSPCGPKQDVLVWATEHARATGHTSFSHHWCNLREDLPQFGPDRGAARVAPAVPAQAPASNGGAASKPVRREPAVGMTIDEVRAAMGNYGTSDGGREDEGEKVIRFLQARTDGGAPATRNVWVTFQNGRATNVVYGQWNR